MKNIFCSVLVMLLLNLACVTSASATVIRANDNVFGINSIIRDLDNGQDFLRLDLTTPYSYNETVAEFGVGGVFEGWSVASLNTMELLGMSTGIVHRSTDLEVLARTEELRDWFGGTNVSSTHTYSRGLISNLYQPTFQYAFSIGRRFNATPNEADFRISGYGHMNAGNEEIFLVRDTRTIPEPATIFLLAGGLTSLGFFRRKRSLKAV